MVSETLIERQGAVWSITNLGAILLAKNLEDFDRSQSVLPKYRCEFLKFVGLVNRPGLINGDQNPQ